MAYTSTDLHWAQLSACTSSLLILMRLPDLSSLPPGVPDGAEAHGGCVDGEGGAVQAGQGEASSALSKPPAGICQISFALLG